MFRSLIRPVIQGTAIYARNQSKINANDVLRKFSQLSIRPTTNIQIPLLCQPSILSNPALIQAPQVVQSRTLTKFSLRKGKRKSVKAVIKRFMRLDWGIWIRTIAGRKKRIWKKSQKQRHRARQHVFTNASQSTMLDAMVGKYWKKPKYYVNDLYTPYHSRENFRITRKKPIDWD
ncbi:hypothetical protein PVAND_000336 [Polypedilum vanderplanki]|uniref:Large ribosomal subunit protein bL35m n=1 Tax=Polypedilum vanderplanki TaxID=319348 RepID=A0A9J6BJZ5_POLVA|nr:hypothetical protein PVAND_000336 [Polypedilum vanderplanki]